MIRAATFLALLLLSLVPAAADSEPAVPRFVDETATAGLTGAYQGDWTFMVGGGPAVFDCNDDGLPDVLTPGGSEAAQLHINRSAIGGPIAFEAVAAGVELGDVAGAYPLDIDSDGITDLAILRVGENVLMRGLGGCRFERANEAWSFKGGDDWTSAFAATFEKGANWPTLAFGNYINRYEEGFPWGSCTPNQLFRPAATGGFAPPIDLKPSFCALSMLFTDWDGSGTQALRVSNDREYYKGGQEQMWRLPSGEPPVLYGEADGWKPLKIWGMGIAAHDLDQDGRSEFFLTSMADNKLQTLVDPKASPARPTYKDVAFAKGVTAHRPYVGEQVKPSTAWHAEFDDANNDGRIDLLVVKGNVAEMPDFAALDPNNLLLQKEDGSFVEAGDKAGVASTKIGRGGALVDLNLDGWLDLIVVNRWSGNEVWRNEGTGAAAGFVQLRLRQPGANPDAIGARIEIRCNGDVDSRLVEVGGGHAGGQLGWIHAGIGASESAEIRVTWPDGTRDDWQPLAPNGFYIVERGAAPKAWQPG